MKRRSLLCALPIAMLLPRRLPGAALPPAVKGELGVTTGSFMRNITDGKFRLIEERRHRCRAGGRDRWNPAVRRAQPQHTRLDPQRAGGGLQAAARFFRRRAVSAFRPMALDP
jgi:hypothetical protein